MQTEHHNIREMLLRLKDFGSRRTDGPKTPLATQLLASLDVNVSDLDEQAAAEASGQGSALSGTVTRAVAREALRQALEEITRTARVIGLDTPGFENKFRLPRSGNDQVLIDAALGYVRDATPIKDKFIAHSLPPDFLTALEAKISALQAAITNQSGSVAGRKSAGVAIDETAGDGLVTARKLDVIMRNHYADDPVALAEWMTARHIERSPKRKPAPANPPPKPEQT